MAATDTLIAIHSLPTLTIDDMARRLTDLIPTAAGTPRPITAMPNSRPSPARSGRSWSRGPQPH